MTVSTHVSVHRCPVIPVWRTASIRISPTSAWTTACLRCPVKIQRARWNQREQKHVLLSAARSSTSTWCCECYYPGNCNWVVLKIAFFIIIISLHSFHLTALDIFILTPRFCYFHCTRDAEFFFHCCLSPCCLARTRTVNWCCFVRPVNIKSLKCLEKDAPRSTDVKICTSDFNVSGWDFVSNILQLPLSVCQPGF